MTVQNTKLSGYNPNRQPASISSYLGLPRISSWKKFANLLGLDTPNKLKCDCFCTGRSMVEMLGVLAIVGVLSVGAIAGYSKAMMKYKLNKQAEQISSILDYVNLHLNDLKRSKTTTAGNITSLLIKLGVVPKEMVKKGSYGVIYDVFGTEIILANYSTGGGNYYFEFTFYGTNKLPKEACLNLFTIGKAKREQLWRTKFQISKNGEESLAGGVYGDAYCTSERKCLKDLTLSEMNTQCDYCKDTDSCVFYYQMVL